MFFPSFGFQILKVASSEPVQIVLPKAKKCNTMENSKMQLQKKSKNYVTYLTNNKLTTIRRELPTGHTTAVT